MLKIDRLRIRLPAHLEATAPDIARLVGEGLAEVDVTGLRSVASLETARVAVPAEATGRDVAGRIVAAIRGQLGRRSVMKGGDR